MGQRGRVDPATLSSILTEIDDPTLRLEVWRLCTALAEADGRLKDGESSVLATAAREWRVGDDCLETSHMLRVSVPGRWVAPAEA
jgi:hypothetical protein